jgi:hypothetical protein
MLAARLLFRWRFPADSLQLPPWPPRSAIGGDVPAMRAQCPLWVISESRTSLGSGPFYPRKRTNSRRGGRSASCQEATYAPQQTAPLNSSPITSRGGGTSRPSILAVWVLMTNSNFDACTTGRSNVQNIAQRKPPSMLDRMPIAFAIMGRRQPRVACWRARRGRTTVLHFVGGIRNRTCRSPP